MCRRAIAILIGKSGSGKSTICRALEIEGYSWLSASKILSELAETYGVAGNKLDLANFGARLKQLDDLGPFHGKVLREMSGSIDVCIDGIRFPETLEEIKKTYPKALVVYVECPEPVRRLRKSMISDEDWKHLERHETELSVESMLPYADTIIDGTKPITAIVSQISDAAKRNKHAIPSTPLTPHDGRGV